MRIKISILHILMILFFNSCISGKQNIPDGKSITSPLIMVDSTKVTSSCGSGFTVSTIIESDYKWRQELEKYLYKSLIDYQVCEKISDTLFTRDSFIRMVLYVYDDSSFFKKSIYDYESRWRESYTNMLLYCTNKDVLYQLTDSLLIRNIDDGLIALWDKDISKLRLINDYTKRNSGDFYKLSQLVIIYHNNGLMEKRDEILKTIISMNKNKKETEVLQRLINRDSKVDYFTYMEEMFGGM